MKRKAFCIVMLLFACAFAREAGAFGLVAQDLEVQLDPGGNRLAARATLSLAAGQLAWPAHIRLAGDAAIASVVADGQPLPFTFVDGRLQLPAAVGSANLTIDYSVRFADPVPQDHVGIEDPSYGITATIMPQGTYLSAGSAWHPRIDGSEGLFKVRITAPPGMTAVTAGRLTEHATSHAETVTAWQTELPQEALALAAGEYQLFRDDLGPIQLLVFMGRKNAELAAGYLESCRQYLQLYQQLFGPYPYSKFAVVENFYPSGYGLPGWTLLGSSVIRLPFIRTTSLPHEIAHAWWGNAIEIDYAAGNWGEGLATYVADYYLKELENPQEAREYRRKLLRDYAALVAAGEDFPLSVFRGRLSKRDQAVGYGKAAMVFHMLRELIGDQAFWAGLQNLARDGLGKRNGWRDLERHFAAVTDVELDVFFRQWTGRAGAPQLRLAEVDVIRTGAVWQVSGTLVQNEPAYQLAVPLRLVTAGRVYEQVIGLSARQDCFLFTVAEPPVSLTVDPDSQLFRQLYAAELPATVNDLRAAKAPLVVVATGSEALVEASRDLLLGLQWQQARIISETDYLATAPAAEEVLLLGWPRSELLKPELPRELTGGDAPFTPAGTLQDGNDEALFLVRQAGPGGQVIAWFLPASLAAARDVARRIPHYGRYSYLLFRDGHNLVKATWEPAASPLQVFFAEEAK